MFDIINKNEYWSWIKKGYCNLNSYTLKNIQDGFMMYRLSGIKEKNILEIGGGNSRVLPVLAKHNECWNIDKFEGDGAGPTSIKMRRNIRIVKSFIGEFDSSIPENYFDYIFSISVVEHVLDDDLENLFKDCARILKRGGRIIHAIDTYIYDRETTHVKGSQLTSKRIKQYLSFSNRADLGIRLVQQPAIDENAFFLCRYASNSDNELYRWNNIAPSMVSHRQEGQSVSIKAEWERL